MKSIKKVLSTIILLIVAIYVVAFTLANQHDVVLDPVVWSQTSNSLAVLMLLSFCSGVLVAGLFASIFLIKKSHHKRQVEKELKKTNKELEKVREESVQIN